MHRLVRREDQLRFGITRALLRRLLGASMRASPGELVFSANRFGRPRGPDEAAAPFCFSVSHSGDYAMIGLARHRPIGVDVEWMRPGATLVDIAPSICGEAELAEVERLPAADRPMDLHRRWTIKEAYLKAIGLGLSFDPKKARVTCVSETGRDGSRRGRYELEVRGRWTLVVPEVAPGYCAAVVVLGTDRHLEFVRIE